MKQFFALMLCLAMLLSLTACGNKEDSPTAPNTPSNTLSDATSVNTNASPDPETITSEETFALQKYVSILQILNNYVADGYIKVQAIVDGEEVKYSGQEALNYCYKQLEELTVVDKWVGTEHTSDTSVNWDRLAVMADFVVIEDVRLSETGITEDSVGNRSAVQQLGTWEYDESGRVSMFQEQSNLKGSADNGNHVFSNLIDQNPSGLRLLCDYTYDENGNLVELSYYRDQVYAKVTPSYDADGNMISATYVLANGTEGSAVYTYDQVGQLVSVTCPQLSESSIDGELVYNYTYNSNITITTSHGFNTYYLSTRSLR